MKAGSTAASSFFVGVIEDELGAKFVCFEFHFCANEGHNSFAIDDHLDALLFDYFIKFFDLIFPDIVHIIGESWASFLAKADFDSNLYQIDYY